MTDKPIYMVTGLPRTGTSMMMYALSEGGLEVADSPAREKQLKMIEEQFGKDLGGYRINDRFFELTGEQYRRADFPSGFEGKLVKAMWTTLAWCPPCRVLGVMMQRNKEEIRASTLNAFAYDAALPSREDYEERQEIVLNTLNAREGWTIIPVDYTECIKDPVAVFTRLKEAGFPIDVEKAAAVPDKHKRRNTNARN